jgi:type I restriction enzyme S subunit
MEKVEARTILKVKTGKYDANHAKENGKYQFFTCALVPFWTDTYSFDDEIIILPGNGANVGEVLYYKGKLEAYQRTYILYDINANVRYLYYYFKKYWIRQITKKQVGSATNYIKMDDILSFEIPLPPLVIQQKIASVLDQVDAIIQNNRVIVQKYEVLTQSLFLDMFGKYINDKSCYIEINKIANFIDYRGKTQVKVQSGIPLISATSVRSGYLDFKRLDYITEDTYSKIMTRGFPKVGDVLFTTEGATMGFTCRVPEGFDRFAVGQRLITLQETANYNSYVLEFMLNSSTIQQEIFNLATGSAVKGISSAKFSMIKIPFPPLNIQVEFKNRIKLIEKLKQQAQLELAKSEELFQSLLQRAFKGELN